MFSFLHSLRAKLILSTLVFLLLLATALALLIGYGFQETQRNAAEQSVEGLRREGLQTLHMLIEHEGLLTTRYFQQPALASRAAAEHLEAIGQIAPDVVDEMPVHITRHPEGHASDTRADRLNDLYIPNFVSPDDSDVQQALHYSAFLDTLAPTLLHQTPQAVGMYYVGGVGVTRYYPAGSFEGLVPPDIDLTLEPWYAPTAPELNPQRRTTWSALYPDDVGNGLMITTCTPVYYDDTFDGMTCLDVTLVQIAEHLERVELTPNSYAFLTDEEGKLIAGPPTAISALTGYDEIPLPEDNNETIGLTMTIPEVRDIIEQGADGIHTVEIDGEQRFLAVTTLSDLGWHLGLMAPIDEVTEEADAVITTIEEGTAQTIRTNILVMTVFFLIAIAGVVFFSIHLTRPISMLVHATRDVASGRLDRTIAVTSRDELGTLATSFNQMTRELDTVHKELAKSHETLEHLVEERTEALRYESEESARLKDEVLQQTQAMIAMSTPLIPVSDDIIVMPIIGSLNEQRSQQVLDTLLKGVAEQRAKVAILDITGVSVVDTFIAQTIIEAAQAVRLLGTSVILTGIRPDVAQTLVALNIDLRTITTSTTLQSGIERARQMR
jgi:anti-anti-sigma regulatory factor/HAMP domain-containing protein